MNKILLPSSMIACGLVSLVAVQSHAVKPQTVEFSAGVSKDQSILLQKSINKLSAKGGGVLHMNKGTYTIGRIDLRSNIHLQIDKGTIIIPSFKNLKSWKSNTIFYLGKKGGKIQNVSIEGVGGKFIVKLPKYKKGLRVAIIANVDNFSISNIDIYDNFTKFSSLSFSASGTDKAHRIIPKHGIISNIANYHSAYGYGTVQIQGGYDIKFNNIYSQGGVTLRAETGYKKNNINQTGGVDKIVAHNIMCEDGSSAVMFSPHTIKNGTVQAENIKAKNCGFAVRIERGFISKKYANPNAKIGSFAKGSYVKNIEATYGTTAQLKPKNFVHVPDKLFHLVSHKLNPDGESYSGPSMAGIINSARYKVEIENLATHGFLYQKPIVYYKKPNYRKYKKWSWKSPD